MNKRILLFVPLCVVLLAFGAWLYFSFQTEKPLEPSSTKQEGFVPLESQSQPAFIQSLSSTEDVRIAFHYATDNPGWPEPEFYTPEGSEEKFISLSKIKDREDQYAYGPEYHSIFSPEGSHWYGGTPVYLFNQDSQYSVAYIGFQINDRNLLSELKIELGIDYLAEEWNFGKSISPFASILGIEPAYACGPGMYLRLVGDSGLIFLEESNGIAWYQLEEPIALYDLRLQYADADCSTKPSYCRDWPEDPPECYQYGSCLFNASIDDLTKGNLRMQIFFKPNNQEGFLKLQVANVVLGDQAGSYYQPAMGEYFDDYYRAFLH